MRNIMMMMKCGILVEESLRSILTDLVEFYEALDEVTLYT